MQSHRKNPDILVEYPDFILNRLIFSRDAWEATRKFWRDSIHKRRSVPFASHSVRRSRDVPLTRRPARLHRLSLFPYRKNGSQNPQTPAQRPSASLSATSTVLPFTVLVKLLVCPAFPESMSTLRKALFTSSLIISQNKKYKFLILIRFQAADKGKG